MRGSDSTSSQGCQSECLVEGGGFHRRVRKRRCNSRRRGCRRNRARRPRPDKTRDRRHDAARRAGGACPARPERQRAVALSGRGFSVLVGEDAHQSLHRQPPLTRVARPRHQPGVDHRGNRDAMSNELGARDMASPQPARPARQFRRRRGGMLPRHGFAAQAGARHVSSRRAARADGCKRPAILAPKQSMQMSNLHPPRARRMGRAPALLAALLTVIGGAGCRGGGATSAAPPTGAIVVVVDALRADHLGTYGYQRPTSPHIDALAADAMRFDRAVTAAPWTLPAMGTLWTSLYPSVHGAVRRSDEITYILDRAKFPSDRRAGRRAGHARRSARVSTGSPPPRSSTAAIPARCSASGRALHSVVEDELYGARLQRRSAAPTGSIRCARNGSSPICTSSRCIRHTRHLACRSSCRVAPMRRPNACCACSTRSASATRSGTSIPTTPAPSTAPSRRWCRWRTKGAAGTRRAARRRVVRPRHRRCRLLDRPPDRRAQAARSV